MVNKINYDFGIQSLGISATYTSGYYDLGEQWQKIEKIVLSIQSVASVGSSLSITHSDDGISAIPFGMVNPAASGLDVGSIFSTVSGKQSVILMPIARYMSIKFVNGATAQDANSMIRFVILTS